MNTTIQPQTDGTLLADMNGPLGYWGPVRRSSATVARLDIMVTLAERNALALLSETLQGRTWSGTNALMNALMAADAITTTGGHVVHQGAGGGAG